MNKKLRKAIVEWFGESEDVIHTCIDLGRDSYIDILLYGYNPWDYVEEMKLNIKHQGLLK